MDRSNVSRWCAFFKVAILCISLGLDLCPLAHKNRTALRCSSHIDDSNMHPHLCCIVHTSLTRAAHAKNIVSVEETSNYNLGSILMLLINLSRSNASMTYVSLICLQNIILHITVSCQSVCVCVCVCVCVFQCQPTALLCTSGSAQGR